jgi:hypothetical protein
MNFRAQAAGLGSVTLEADLINVFPSQVSEL